MNKFNLEFLGLNFITGILALIFSALFLWFFYYKQNYNVSNRVLRTVYTLRFLILFLILFLVLKPILNYYYFESKSARNFLLLDASYSLENYRDSVKFFENILNEKISLLQTERFSADTKNETDIFLALNNLIKNNQLTELDNIYLLSDGNHNTDSYLNESSLPAIHTLAVGKKLQKNSLLISPAYKTKQVLNAEQLERFYLNFTSNALLDKTVELKFFVNDSIVLTSKLELNDGILTKDFSLKNFSLDSVINIKAMILGENIKKEARFTYYYKKEEQTILYVFDSPSLEAKYFINSISENKKILRLPFANLAQFLPNKNELFESILISISQLKSAQEMLNLEQVMARLSNPPLIIFSNTSLTFKQAGINTLNLNLKTQSTKLEFDLLIDFKLKEYLNLKNSYKTSSSFPQISYMPQQLSLLNGYTYEAFFTSSDFIGSIKNNQIQTALLITSLNFWQVHASLQNDLASQSIYTNFVQELYRGLISAKQKILYTNLRSLRLELNKSSDALFFAKYSNEDALSADRLLIKIKFKSETVLEKSFDYNSSGNYPFSLQVNNPGLYKVELATFINNQQILQSYESFNVKENLVEETLPVNYSFLKLLSEQSSGQFIENINLLKVNKADPVNILKSDQYTAYNSPFMLVLLIVLLVAEWLLRKHFKLP